MFNKKIKKHSQLVQIGLEIRDVPVANGQKATLTNRHQCYEAELKRLQLEFTNAKLADGGGGASLYGDSSDFDEFSNGPGGIRAEQQTRLLDNSERIERTGRRLEDGYRTVLETEGIGATVLQDLAQQRETLQRSRARVNRNLFKNEFNGFIGLCLYFIFLVEGNQ